MTTAPSIPEPTLFTEFLLLPDGKILVQNLTPVMAAILLEFNPGEEAIRRRVPNPQNTARPSRRAGQAVPCPPTDCGATLNPPPMPDGGQRSARPTSAKTPP